MYYTEENGKLNIKYEIQNELYTDILFRFTLLFWIHIRRMYFL